MCDAVQLHEPRYPHAGHLTRVQQQQPARRRGHLATPTPCPLPTTQSPFLHPHPRPAVANLSNLTDHQLATAALDSSQEASSLRDHSMSWPTSGEVEGRLCVWSMRQAPQLQARGF